MQKSNQATIKSIAETLGLSHSTVSRALRNLPVTTPETRERVQKLAAAQGYVAHAAARLMRGERSALIGLVVPDVQTDLFSTLATALGKACTARGFNLLLSISQHDPAIEEAQIRTLREARVSGIILYPTASLSHGSIDLLSGVPAVQVARRHPDLATPFVGTEDAPSMAALVGHLVAFGHRQIAFIGSNPSLSPGADRLLAFKDTLRNLGHSAEPALICSGEATADAGAAATRALLSHACRPTALMVASAPMAEGALGVLTEAGLRIPHDMSFTGFGDPAWYKSWGPGITSVSMPTAEVADTALAMLLERGGAAGTMKEACRLPTTVMLRGSCGPAAPKVKQGLLF